MPSSAALKLTRGVDPERIGVEIDPPTSSFDTGEVVPTPTFRPELKSVFPRAKFDAKRLVELAVVAKKFVEVALVVVEFPTLRSERVEDENTMMPPPPFGVMSLPVEVAHFDWLMFEAVRHDEPVDDTRPLADAVRQPVPVARKRFEVDAVVVKRLVVVALDPVAFTKVKLPRIPVPRLKLVAKRLVEEAVVAKVFVVVAFVPVAFKYSMPPWSSTEKTDVEAAFATSNTRAPVFEVPAHAVRRANGVDVPTPTRPLVLIVITSVPLVTLPIRKFKSFVDLILPTVLFPSHEKPITSFSFGEMIASVG
jgi:hypothetical protein